MRMNDGALTHAKAVRANNPTSQLASQADVWDLFRVLVQQIPGLVLILDGFDEYSNQHDFRLRFLQKLKTKVTNTSTRLIISSRHESNIAGELHANALNTGLTRIECSLTRDAVSRDIELFSQYVVDRRLAGQDESMKKDIALTMASKAGGMFLWIKLQEEHLRKGRSKKRLIDILEGMPTELMRPTKGRGLSSTTKTMRPESEPTLFFDGHY